MRYYLDTSAAAKLLALEAETGALASFLDEAVNADHSIVSSFLLETELRRFAVRHSILQAGIRVSAPTTATTPALPPP